MKKNWFNDRACDALVKWLRMMKLTFLILLVTFMHLSASVYSQQAKLSLSLRNVTIRDALKQIEDQSDFFFMYKGEEINVSQNVNLQIESKSIEEILDNLFKGTNISYEIVNRQIVLTNNGLNGNLRIAVQQQRTVKGKVTGSNGEPIPGATIVVKGTNNGTITDIDGNYTLPNVPSDATLVCSFVGMRTQEVFVGNKTTIQVVMEEDAIGINEVVVVGYGVQKKVNMTGSVAVVDFEELAESRPVMNVSSAMAGLSAGVQVLQSSGQPGSDSGTIRVRGTGT
ncbi:MAG: carboxypeptidase-like regulatory domain-containing protein, partial [Bacteroidales bacterium]